MRCRALCLAVVSLAVAAPNAAAQVVGAAWAGSSTGHLAFVTEEEDGSAATLRVVSPDGVVGAPEPLGGSSDTPTPAVGARGDVIVAWTDDQDQLWVRYRPVGGPLGRAELVAPSASPFDEAMPPLALDASGVALVAWAPGDGGGGLHIRARDPVTGWGAAQSLSGRDVHRPKLALADNGHATIAWSQRGPKRVNDRQVAVSLRAPGGPFGPPRVIAGVQRHPASPVVGTNDRGDAVVAWIQTEDRRDDVNFSVYAAFAAPGGAFGRPALLSRRNATAPAVAVLPSGRMVLAWRDNRAHRVEARIRSAAGTLGPARRLTRRLSLNTGPAALAAGPGAVGWSDSVKRRRVVRVAAVSGEDGFATARVVARVRGSVLDPAFTPAPLGLSVVAAPPWRPADPIRWQRIALS